MIAGGLLYRVKEFFIFSVCFGLNVEEKFLHEKKLCKIIKDCKLTTCVANGGM